MIWQSTLDWQEVLIEVWKLEKLLELKEQLSEVGAEDGEDFLTLEDMGLKAFC